jgi:hypothetical protein
MSSSWSAPIENPHKTMRFFGYARPVDLAEHEGDHLEMPLVGDRPVVAVVVLLLVESEQGQGDAVEARGPHVRLEVLGVETEPGEEDVQVLRFVLGFEDVDIAAEHLVGVGNALLRVRVDRDALVLDLDALGLGDRRGFGLGLDPDIRLGLAAAPQAVDEDGSEHAQSDRNAEPAYRGKG